MLKQLHFVVFSYFYLSLTNTKLLKILVSAFLSPSAVMINTPAVGWPTYYVACTSNSTGILVHGMHDVYFTQNNTSSCTNINYK